MGRRLARDAGDSKLAASIEIEALDELRMGNPQGGFKLLGSHAFILSCGPKAGPSYVTAARAAMAGCDRAPHPAMGQRISRARPSGARSTGPSPPSTCGLGKVITRAIFK
jgi:hypothetical protein